MSSYSHRQRGLLPWLVLPFSGVTLFAAWAVREQEPHQALLPWVLVGAAGIMVVAALSFAWLELSHDGDALRVTFGPLRVARMRVRYADIETVEPARSSFLDGWGIHGFPGRGTIWNVHGFDCVELRLKSGRRLRLGTDDQAGLLEHLRSRIV